MNYMRFEELEKGRQDLVLHAEKAMLNAFNPYSNFFVGSAVLTQKGNIYVGANFENSAQASICAERSALLAANVAGDRMIECVVVITKAGDFDVTKPTSCCGSCRQFINDFAEIGERNIELLFVSTAKEIIMQTSIHELLPDAFGFQDAGVDLTRFKN